MVARGGLFTALGHCMPEGCASPGKYTKTTVCKIPTEKQVRLLLFKKFESPGTSRIHGSCEGSSIKLPDTCPG